MIFRITQQSQRPFHNIRISFDFWRSLASDGVRVLCDIQSLIQIEEHNSFGIKKKEMVNFIKIDYRYCRS